MLSNPLNLSKINATEIIDFLYNIFHRDFVANQTTLANCIYINPQSNQLDNGKEKVFWHLTTKNTEYWQTDNNGRKVRIKERLTDFQRASRLEWVKQILENHNHNEIKCFYHKESTGNKSIRLYLWAFNNDFVVILEKLGKSQAFLVTSFYIDYDGKRKDFQKRYEIYQNKLDSQLHGCEWF